MASKTLLQLINAAQNELGLPQSSSVIGNTDKTTKQMLSLINVEVDELRKVHDWTALQVEYNLIVNVPLMTTGDVANDSAVITNIPDTSTLSAGNFQVIGPDVPTAARILSVDSPTQITMTMEATGTVAGASLLFAQDTYPEPPDFDHFQNRTWWDRTNRWELLGPDSPQLDQWHRSGIVVTGPRRHFRQVGRGIPQLGGKNYRLWPPPAEIVNPVQLVFEYISNASILAGGTGSTYITEFASDSDICSLSDRCLINGLKWRFWQIKGFNYVPMQNDYADYVEREVARDGGAQTLQLAKRVHPIFISPANVQDGFFPGPVGPNS